MTSVKRIIAKITESQFLRASSIVLIGSLVGNVISYVFNLIMGVLLPPSVYADVVSLSTLLLIVGVPSATFALVIAKYSATHWARDEHPAMRALFRAATQLGFIIGGIGLLIALIATPWLSSYLKIPEFAVLLFVLLIPLSFISGSSSGFLQGVQEFVPLSIYSVLGTVLKFVFAVGLVYLGFSLGGVIVALVMSSLLAYFYALYCAIRSANKVPRQADELPHSVSWRALFKDKQDYILLAFIATLSLTVFTNVDVIMAKHYLPAIAASQYAALSVVGKIITYGSSAILTVLFPLVSASQAKGDAKEAKYLGWSLGIVGGASLLMVILFSFFPTVILHLLFGTRYLSAAPFLAYFAGAIGFSSVATVLVQFFLAVHNKMFIYPLIILTLGEIGGIIAFHNNIHQIVLSSFITAILLSVSFIGVYWSFQKGRMKLSTA